MSSSKKYTLNFEITGTKQNIKAAFRFIAGLSAIPMANTDRNVGPGVLEPKLIKEGKTTVLSTSDMVNLERFEELTGIV